MNFIDKRISVKKTIAILEKNGISVNDEEAATILDFLYLIAKNYRINREDLDIESPKRNRTWEKM